MCCLGVITVRGSWWSVGWDCALFVTGALGLGVLLGLGLLVLGSFSFSCCWWCSTVLALGLLCLGVESAVALLVCSGGVYGVLLVVLMLGDLLWYCGMLCIWVVWSWGLVGLSVA